MCFDHTASCDRFLFVFIMRIISVRVGVCACMCIRLSQGEDETALRRCYEGVERDGEVIHVRDTVLLRSGPRKKSLPYVAKISSLWEDPKTGEGEEGGRGRSRVDTAVCAYACVDAGKGHMAEMFYLCVCVRVSICLLRRADDESVLVLPTRAHPGRSGSQRTL